MRTAFKEWAIVVDALGRGDQIVILRKGGIAEGRGGFKMDHPEFLLFPTLFHQQRDSVLPHAQIRFDQICTNFPPASSVRIVFFSRVVEWRQLESCEAAYKLTGQHIWRDEVIAQRFDWGKNKGIFALAVRIFQLPKPTTVSMLPEYGGCKSWIELAEDVSTSGAIPVLNDALFEQKLQRFRESLELT